MPCASCGRWVDGQVDWIAWNADEGLACHVGSSHYLFCGRSACQRTRRLIRPVFTARAHDYMALQYGTIYDKRGNIVWRLGTPVGTPTPDGSQNVWHARDARGFPALAPAAARGQSRHNWVIFFRSGGTFAEQGVAIFAAGY